MKTNKAGLDLIKRWEGLKLSAYKCQAGIPTIGYGHTKKVRMGDKCTEAQANQWLSEDLTDAENAVNRLVTVALSENQFATLVSFTFNLGEGNFGSSTLLKKVNAGHFDEVPDQLRRWVYADGEVSQGLKNRREDECKLWNTSVEIPKENQTVPKPKPIEAGGSVCPLYMCPLRDKPYYDNSLLLRVGVAVVNYLMKRKMK